MKKILSLALALIMVMSLFNGVTVSAATVTASGTCGDNLTWSLSFNGVLTISGEGWMDDYYDDLSAPWYYCKDLIETVIIEKGVTTIGEDAFGGCSSLTSIEIPDSVTSIGLAAFGGCTSLTSVVIPESVTSINHAAFNSCTSLTSIEIPDSVTSIGEYVFSGCDSLETITVASGNTKYHSRGNCLIETGTNTLVSGCKNSIIPDYVTSIGNSAFFGCSSLTSIEIPNGVTSIGYDAFYNCSSLVSIKIPDGVTSIGDSAFYNCTALTDVYYDGYKDQWNEISIGSHNAYLTNANIHFVGIYSGDCGDNLTWTYTGDLLTISGEGAMYGYTSSGSPWYDYKDSIKTVIIEDGVTSIGSYAFYTCDAVTSIEIPETVTTIGDSAFRGCTILETVEIPDTVTNIGDYAFRSCKSITSIKIPYGVESIGFSAFSWCEALTEIDIPDTVTSIGEDAFRGCIALATIKIPDGVPSIGNNAFRGSTALASIEIPDTVTSIGDYAFSSCTALTDVYYGGAEAEWNKISLGKNNDCLTNAEVHFADASVTISGTIKSFGDATQNVTVELISDGTTIDSKIVTSNGTYTFEGILNGEYTVRVSKTKHATREYEVTVADTHVTQDAEIWLYGDATGDGSINNVDILHINRKTVNLSSLFSTGAEEDKEYRFKVANVTGAVGTDMVVNSIDILHINRKIVYLSSVFDKIA